MSKRWVDLERAAAHALGGQRVHRDLFDKAQDVYLPDFPELSVDCKAYRRFKHHALMRCIQSKYGGTPLLVSKEPGQVGAYATVPLDFLAHLLNIARTMRDRRTA